MKNKVKMEKDFDTVKTFGEIKEKISKDIKGMTFEELTTCLESRKSIAKTEKHS